MSTAPLLPLYIVRKTAGCSRFGGKKIIAALTALSILGTLALLINLPPNKATNQNDGMLNGFMPNNDNNNNPGLIHDDHHRHRVPDGFLLHQSPSQPFSDAVDHAPNQEDDSINTERRNHVKKMMELAWSGYKKFAWGQNELKPIARSGHSPGIFGRAANLGATIVDSLDTLYIMGLMDEFNDAKDWIIKNLNLNIDSEFSLFEVNIRFVGGLLAAHSLTNEKIFLDKAKEIADLLMPAFKSETGIPYSLVNPISKGTRNYGWAVGSCSILAEIGTLSLEYQYLTDHTGDAIYEQKIKKIYEALDKAPKSEGLYFNYISPSGGNWCGRQATLGGLADSFYEYLIKYWLYTDRTDQNMLNTYTTSMKHIREKLVTKSREGLTYVGEYNNGGFVKKMSHLSCFSGGMFALSSIYIDDQTKSDRDAFSKLAEELTSTCHESYIRTQTHLGPESFYFDHNGKDATAINSNDMYYILRPEVVESYFYLWRTTKQQKYRDWAWEAVQALEKHSKTENGYSGLGNVYDVNSRKDDVQQSFFLAETLKYLYLIFCDDSVISLDQFVFNTEAHPLRIRKSIKEADQVAINS